jgi:hypothetical protein
VVQHRNIYFYHDYAGLYGVIIIVMVSDSE